MPDAQGQTTLELTERRFLADCELRVVSPVDDPRSPGTLTGYAAVFDSPSDERAGFRETVAKGAFAESLKRGDDVPAFIEHQGGLSTLGRTATGTLKLKEDSRGLHATIVLPNTQAGRDVPELVTRGDLGHMSFGFVAPEGGVEWIEGKTPEADVRVLKQVDLVDVSVVALPVYPATDVQVAKRSRAAWQDGRTSRLAKSAKVQSRWREIHLTRAKNRLRLGR